MWVRRVDGECASKRIEKMNEYTYKMIRLLLIRFTLTSGEEKNGVRRDSETIA